uniref:Uncharacterized protein n=1 Tax=Anguilla anguilla TaxID=7936 RepID=A0A0E9VEL6_ANGAN
MEKSIRTSLRFYVVTTLEIPLVGFKEC